MGIERPSRPPHLLPPDYPGGPTRRPVVLRGPSAERVRRVGRPVAGNRRRIRHRALQHGRPRDSRKWTREPRVHRTGHPQFRRIRPERGGVDPRTRRGSHQRTRPRHPLPGPCLCQGRSRPVVLDAGNYRASQRHRQCAGPHQPGPALRARGPLRVGPGAPPGPEQRAGGRRHGGDPQQVPRFPGCRVGRNPGPLRSGMEGIRPSSQGTSSHPDVRGHGGGTPARPVCHRREPRRVRGRRQPGPRPSGGTGLHSGPGHLLDPHRSDGRRRVPRRR